MDDTKSKEVGLVYYINLRKEMRRQNIVQGDIARVLGQNEILVAKKLNAQMSFTLEEAEKIRLELFPDTELIYLFQVKSIVISQQGRSESHK